VVIDLIAPCYWWHKHCFACAKNKVIASNRAKYAWFLNIITAGYANIACPELGLV